MSYRIPLPAVATVRADGSGAAEDATCDSGTGARPGATVVGAAAVEETATAAAGRAGPEIWTLGGSATREPHAVARATTRTATRTVLRTPDISDDFGEILRAGLTS